MKPRYASDLLFSLVFCILLAGFTCIFVLQAQGENHPPFVSNVRAQQRSGTKLVDITYDVSDPDGDLLTISVAVSDDGIHLLTFEDYTGTQDN